MSEKSFNGNFLNNNKPVCGNTAIWTNSVKRGIALHTGPEESVSNHY